MTELAEGARLEIVCAPKEYLGSNPYLSARLLPRPRGAFHTGFCPDHTRKGGRAAECGGLENRFTGDPGDQGSNPCPSASFIKQAPSGAFLFDRGALMVNRLSIILE